MRKKLELTGKRFGRLNVLGYHGLSNNGNTLWEEQANNRRNNRIITQSRELLFD